MTSLFSMFVTCLFEVANCNLKDVRPSLVTLEWYLRIAQLITDRDIGPMQM